MIDKIEEKYLTEFGGAPLLIKAPGRINLIGEHTDYNNGFVMPASIDKAMYFAIGKKEGQGNIQIQSINYNELIILNGTTQNDLPSWANYLKAILEILKEKKHKIEGLNCVFGGDIPIGAGLSSSAALCCGFIYGISTLLDLNIPRKEIALIAQEAEHRIGLNCGLMDQYAVLFGKKDHVFKLDCKDLEIEYFSMQLENHSLVLINSNIEHELEDTPYNERRASCENVVALVATKHPLTNSLRDVTMEMLQEFKNQIDPLDFKRAKYVLDENDRVRQMIIALQEGRLKEVGAILLKGHQGMSKEFDISLPEIDLLVDLAQKEKSVLGARMMGGGFGGCTINLIENEHKEVTLKRIEEAYFKNTNIKPAIHAVSISDGLSKVEFNLEAIEPNS